MKQHYSILKQIKYDYSTTLGFIGFTVFTIFLFVIMFIQERVFTLVLDVNIIFGSLSLLSLILFLIRIKIGIYFVKYGLEMNAIITDFIYLRNARRVEYSYNINGMVYKRGNAITSHLGLKFTMEMLSEYKIGGNVKILVDPKNNKKAIIMKNFIKEQ